MLSDFVVKKTTTIFIFAVPRFKDTALSDFAMKKTMTFCTVAVH